MAKVVRAIVSGLTGVGVHMGKILLRAASIYPSLLEVILEQVQNGIDANASEIWVTINQKAHKLSIKDNGDGATKANFEEALDTVGHSEKAEDKLGRFGLGLCSPLGKCVRHTFTSTPKSNPRGYITWTFETDKIREMKEVKVPHKARPDLHFGTTGVLWRTEVSLEKYTTDRFINKVTMASLCEGILKYQHAMKHKNVTVHVTIEDAQGKRETRAVQAEDFQGTALEVQYCKGTDGGQTTFKLFLAKTSKAKKDGKVWVGEARNPFRIKFSTFLRSLPEGSKLNEETAQALLSGVFEGDILNSKIALQDNRRGFEPNDALLCFCVAIDEWYEKFGREHFEQTRTARNEQRYQNLGLRSMRVFEALIKSSTGEHIQKFIESFKMGSIGTGHVPRKHEPGEQLGIAVVPVASAEKADNGGSDKGTPVNERKTHHPFVVQGPLGKKRKVVRSHSLGLSLAHEPLPGDKLWEFDVITGTITLNIKHPLWVQCAERGDRMLLRFQEYLMVQALTVQVMPEDWRERVRSAADEATSLYAFTLIHGDSLTGIAPTASSNTNDKPAKKLALAKRA